MLRKTEAILIVKREWRKFTLFCPFSCHNISWGQAQSLVTAQPTGGYNSAKSSSFWTKESGNQNLGAGECGQKLSKGSPILSMSQHSPEITLCCHRHFTHPTKQSEGTENWTTTPTTTQSQLSPGWPEADPKAWQGLWIWPTVNPPLRWAETGHEVRSSLSWQPAKQTYKPTRQHSPDDFNKA